MIVAQRAMVREGNPLQGEKDHHSPRENGNTLYIGGHIARGHVSSNIKDQTPLER